MTKSGDDGLATRTINNKKQTAYLFDVDGVLTNPELKTVKYVEIFKELITRLNNNDIICLNTGRSLDFVTKKILIPLEKMVVNKSVLQNLYSICEKGNVWSTYAQNKRKSAVDHRFSVPKKICEEISSLVSQKEFSDFVFFDKTKSTMATIELKEGRSIEEFKKISLQLELKLKNIIKNNSLDDELKIYFTTIAIDIENKNTGKAFATEKFLAFLKDKNIKPTKFICFGDSPSDYEMHEKLISLNLNSTFIFVNDEKNLSGKKLDKVLFTEEHFDLGTLNFLKSQVKTNS